MKILFVVADLTFVGGIERVICNLANELVKNGYSIEILSLYKSNNNCNFSLCNKVTVSFLSDKNKYTGKPGSFIRLLKHFKNIYSLKKFINNNTYDIIVSNSFPTSFQLFFTKKTCQWITYEHVHYNYYNNFTKKIRNIIYNKYDRIVVLTNKDNSLFKTTFNNVVTIHNPIGFSSKDISTVNNKSIITVGRLEYQKGFDILINILNNPNFKESEWKLNIFGTGSKKSDLQKTITVNNINNIFLKGNSQDIKSEMLKSDFLVLSSRFEGFPMVLAEAMECGLPCISFDCPNGPSDIIINGENGFLIEMNDNDLFFEKIMLLVESDDLRKELSINAKKSTYKFTLENITNSWMHLFSGLKNEK